MGKYGTGGAKKKHKVAAREKQRKEGARASKRNPKEPIGANRNQYDPTGASGTQRVNAVIRSAAALRAPLTSLQNVKKNPRTLPKICQKVIKKYPKG